MINVVSKNRTQRKIERSVANLPLWHILGWPSSYVCNDGVLTNTGYASLLLYDCYVVYSDGVNDVIIAHMSEMYSSHTIPNLMHTS